MTYEDGRGCGRDRPYVHNVTLSKAEADRLDELVDALQARDATPDHTGPPVVFDRSEALRWAIYYTLADLP